MSFCSLVTSESRPDKTVLSQQLAEVGRLQSRKTLKGAYFIGKLYFVKWRVVCRAVKSATRRTSPHDSLPHVLPPEDVTVGSTLYDTYTSTGTDL